MARRSDVRRIALFLGAAGAAVVTGIALRRRFGHKRAITQALTVRVSKEQALAFFRDPERVSYAVSAAGIHLNDVGLDARDDMVTWNGGGVYLREAPGGRGTEIHLTLHSARKYPVKDAIRRAKALLETGEIPTGSYTR